jgi:hypothetical protein
MWLRVKWQLAPKSLTQSGSYSLLNQFTKGVAIQTNGCIAALRGMNHASLPMNIGSVGQTA